MVVKTGKTTINNWFLLLYHNQEERINNESDLLDTIYEDVQES